MKKQIKIGFVGTQGTGKTTTCYDTVASLKKMGFDACIANETARMCPFPINKNSTLKTSQWIFAKQTLQELESKTHILICDRTILDVLVYSSVNKIEGFMSISPYIKEQMKSYDLLFYIKPLKNYAIEDGVRDTDKKYRLQVDKRFDYYIRIFGLKVIITDKPVYDILKVIKQCQY